MSATGEPQNDVELGRLEPAATEKEKNKDKTKEEEELWLTSDSFAGLTMEQVRKYESDPFWRKTRLVLFVLFWLVWALLLAVGVIIVVVSPKCPPRPALEAYQKAFSYKVMPLSFADSDGDKVGDLKGLQQKLDYIKRLGANSITIGPIHRAVDESRGLYNTLSYADVHEKLGSWKQLRELARAANKLGVQVFVELNLNMASDQHKDADNFLSLGYEPLNCSLRMRERYQSAWVRNQSKWSYSSFGSGYLEWDFGKDSVRKMALDAVSLLLDAEVDGVVLKDASYLYEDLSACSAAEDGPGSFWQADHKACMNQDKNLEIVESIAAKVRELNALNARKKRLLFVEVDSPGLAEASVYRKFLNRGADGVVVDWIAHMVPQDLQNVSLQQRLTAMFASGNWWPLWQLSSPEYGRVAVRLGESNLKPMLALSVLLPGTLVNYYGDEIGMTHANAPQDVMERDSKFFLEEYRQSMQWSAASSWSNVEAQQANGYPSGKSITRFISDLIEAKKAYESLQWGQFRALNTSAISSSNTDLVAFGRVAQGFKTVVVYANLANTDKIVKLNPELTNSLGSVATSATVVFSSDEALQKDSDVDLDNSLFLRANQLVALVLN